MQLGRSAATPLARIVVPIAAAVLASAALVAGAASQTSLAESSSDGRKIAFIRDGDLYVMNADGSAAKRLVKGSAYLDEFAWSPDGRRIAFIKGYDDPKPPYRHYPGEIYGVGVDGDGLRRITRRRAANPEGLTWSPDGRWLAFARSANTCNYCSEFPFDVVVVNGSSGTERWLAPKLANSRSPAWSPTGRWIALEGDASQQVSSSSIYVVRDDSSRIRSLTQGARPEWAHDGRELLFLRGSDIWRVGVDGSGARRLARGVRVMDDFGGLLPPPSWSPDGQRIVFARNAGGLRAHIWVMNADGAHKRRLTAGTVEDERPVWSPDGTQIAFTRYVSRGENFSIYTINADGQGLQRLTRGPYDGSPGWQPSG